MARYGMALDYKNCINCKACEVACKENGRFWILLQLPFYHHSASTVMMLPARKYVLHMLLIMMKIM